MKKLITLLLISIFTVSSLQVCCCIYGAYYDSDYNYYNDNVPSYTYPQQPILIPVVVPPNPSRIVINNNPSATSSSESSNGVSVQKILKWGVILGGLAYVYFKFGSPILAFISGVPQKISDFLNSISQKNESSQKSEEFNNVEGDEDDDDYENYEGEDLNTKSKNSNLETLWDNVKSGCNKFFNVAGVVSVFNTVWQFLMSDKPLSSSF